MKEGSASCASTQKYPYNENINLFILLKNKDTDGTSLLLYILVSSE